MSLHAFLEDLKKRKFFREISVYALSSWLIIQVAATTHDYIGVPKFAVTLVIVALLLGLPVFMLYSWRHDIYSKLTGKARENIGYEVSDGQKISNRMFYRLLAITSILVITGSGFIFKHNFLDIQKAQLVREDHVAISIFQNNTREQQYDMIGEMISDYVSRGLTNANLTRVISFSTINRQATLLGSMQTGEKLVAFLNSQTGASKIIDGSYYLSGDKLTIASNLINGRTGETLFSFKDVSFDVDQIEDGVKELTQYIMGFWALKIKDPRLAQGSVKFDAYKLYLEAFKWYGKDYDRSLDLVNQAIEVDSNFTQAYFLKSQIFKDLGRIGSARNLIEEIRNRQLAVNQKEELLLEYYTDFCDYNFLEALNHIKELHELYSEGETFNTQLALQYLENFNLPEKALETLRLYRGESIDYTDCQACLTRKYVEALSIIKIGEYEKALNLLDPATLKTYARKRSIYLLKIQAAIHLSRFEEIDLILTDSKINQLDYNYRYLYYYASVQSHLVGNEEMKLKYGQLALQEYGNDGNSYMRMFGRIHYLMGNWETAESYIDQYLENRPEDIFSLAQKVAVLHYTGRQDEAEEYLQQLIQLDQSATTKDVLRETAYHIGRVYAILGNPELAVQSLKKSFEFGQNYFFAYFDGDPDLMDNLSDEQMQLVLNHYSDKVH